MLDPKELSASELRRMADQIELELNLRKELKKAKSQKIPDEILYDLANRFIELTELHTIKCNIVLDVCIDPCISDIFAQRGFSVVAYEDDEQYERSWEDIERDHIKPFEIKHKEKVLKFRNDAEMIAKKFNIQPNLLNIKIINLAKKIRKEAHDQ